MTIYNMLNAHERPNYDEFNDEASMTVPDQTMDLREILVRFATGQTLGGTDNGLQYMEDDEIENASGIHINKLDLTERDELKIETAARINYLRGNETNVAQNRSGDNPESNQNSSTPQNLTKSPEDSNEP